MLIPENLRYTSEHEWVELLGDDRIRVGITDYAQDALGDVVFVQLPKVDVQLTGHALMAEVESTKSVAEVYAPIPGTVSEVNQELATHPELINQEPYGAGWFCVLTVADASSLDALLDAEAYRALTE
jgi:glycine cleavage system H protein